jgi:hypothetical protein
MIIDDNVNYFFFLDRCVMYKGTRTGKVLEVLKRYLSVEQFWLLNSFITL